MSLKVNGVIIPETDGAIKVGTTNVQKVVVDGTTVWEVSQVYTISWSDTLSQYGTFINKTSPPSSSDFFSGCKQIRYTKPDGSIAVANPYKAGSIKIKKGTTVYLDMFAGTNSTYSSFVGWYIGGSYVSRRSNRNCELCSEGYVPTASGSLNKQEDTTKSNAKGSYDTWYVNINEST